VYQGARSALQSQSIHRAKFLDTSTTPPTNGHAPPAVTSASNGHAAGPSTSQSNGHATHPPNRAAKSPAPKIQRFILKTNASKPEKQYFHNYIAQLKQLNPQWNVSLDTCQAGEAEAYVMFPQDENYTLNRAAYGAAQLITQFFSPSQRP
jgi:hypothetical protein